MPNFSKFRISISLFLGLFIGAGLVAINGPSGLFANGGTPSVDPLNNPDLTYTSFMGGNDHDKVGGATLNQYGHIIVAGYTNSTDFSTTSNAYDQTHNGDFDGFLYILSKDGKLLLTSTYFGGSEHDKIHDVAVDTSGYIYVTGFTHSSDFPHTTTLYGPTQPTTITEIFVTKFDPSGTQIIYSTLIGGAYGDRAYSIEVDDLGKVYITGESRSPGLPTTSNGFQSVKSGNHGQSDAFILKLNQAGNAIEYGTFLGGLDSHDIGYAIILDNDGNPIITGETYSDDFPVSAGAFDTTFDSQTDAFAAKILLPSGNLEFAGYIGGNNKEVGRSLAVDSANNIFVAGTTNSTKEFPITSGAFNSNYGPGVTSFVTKITSDGSSIIESTFVGAAHGLLPTNDSWSPSIVHLPERDSLFLVGTTSHVTFPVTSDAFDAYFDDGEGDIILVELSDDLSSMKYGTFLGHVKQDVGIDLMFGSDGSLTIVGHTYSAGLRTTFDAVDRDWSARYDTLVMQFDEIGFTPAVSCTGNETIVAENGRIIIEAENFKKNKPGTGIASNTFWGYEDSSNQNFVQVKPDGGVYATSDISYSPSLEYEVYFDQVGPYYLYLRGYGLSGGSDSVHVGINGNRTTSDSGFNGFTTTLAWQEGWDGGNPILIYSPTVGKQTLNIWMREDGFVLDRIWLDKVQQSIDGDTSTGPSVSPCIR